MAEVKKYEQVNEDLLLHTYGSPYLPARIMDRTIDGEADKRFTVKKKNAKWL